MDLVGKEDGAACLRNDEFAEGLSDLGGSSGAIPASEIGSDQALLICVVWFHGDEDGRDLDGEE